MKTIPAGKSFIAAKEPLLDVDAGRAITNVE
jgi:hypothetical protein